MCRDVHFSGPLHPAELGAAIASADIHLSSEHESLQARLNAQIDLVRALAIEYGVSFVSSDHSPIWFVRAGGTRQAIELAGRMIDDGFYLNVSFFPAVPVGQGGRAVDQHALSLGQPARRNDAPSREEPPGRPLRTTRRGPDRNGKRCRNRVAK